MAKGSSDYSVQRRRSRGHVTVCVADVGCTIYRLEALELTMEDLEGRSTHEPLAWLSWLQWPLPESLREPFRPSGPGGSPVLASESREPPLGKFCLWHLCFCQALD